MKPFRLLLLFVPLFLAACGLSPQQKADYGSVQSSGVTPAIYDKMVNGDALSVYDIKALSRAHVSDAVILRYIRDHGTVYFLNSDDVVSLRKAGVSQSIIDYMLQTPRMSGPGDYPGYPYPYWYGPPWFGGVYFYGGYHGGYHHGGGHWR
jgi:hypothetical protein